MSSKFPKELKYTSEHEWVRLEDNVGRVGITAFAAEQLGEVVFVELGEAGDKLAQGDEFGSVESVKAVSELFAPLSGVVVQVNSRLQDSPECINEQPYDEGWMIEIELSDPDQVDGLMDAEAYAEFVGSQG